MISNNTQEKAYLCIRNHLEHKCGKRLNTNHFNLHSTKLENELENELEKRGTTRISKSLIISTMNL